MNQDNTSSKKLLFSAYFCSPYLKSEAYSAFHWAEMISQEYPIIVVTAIRYQKHILKYYDNKLPENMEVVGIDDEFVGRKWIHDRQIYLGYFVYMNKLVKLLKNKPELYDEVGLLFHRNPCSYRYFTGLHKLNKPLIIGPVSGGLQPPKPLKEYFKSERAVNKLRRFSGQWLKLPVFKKQYANASKVLITSGYVLDIIPHIDRNKAVTIMETMISPPKEMVLREGKKQVKDLLFVGRLVRYKGPEMIIDALNKDPSLPVRMHFAGDGPELSILVDKVASLGLEDKVVFHGYTDGDDLKALYEKADIFCFPTLKEAAGNVLLEAMAAALPIITVNYGGPKDIVPDEGGIKLEINNYDKMVIDLTEAIRQLAADEKTRKAMGEYNFSYCHRHYAWDSLPNQLFPIINEFMEKESTEAKK